MPGKFAASCFFLVLVFQQLAAGQGNPLPASFSALDKPVTPAALRAFAFSKPWLKLLHYKKNLFGRYKSQVDSASFFLDAQGKTAPLRELVATLDFFLTNRQAYNRFPARHELVARHFGLRLPVNTGPDLAQFLADNRTASVSVAFSSYYLNSPASIFGHLFMKLENRNSSLLDTGIDFTADTTGAGTFTFLVGGMTGYFAGKYSILPFHKKLREYNDYENRDVWLYRLRMPAERQDYFIKHLWELSHIKYDYYFLTENCAYHILSAIEAVFPEHELTGKTGGLVIPVQSLRILVDHKLVERVENIPSLRNLFLENYRRIGRNEKKLFHAVIRKHRLPDAGPGRYSPILLDALIDYFNYKYPSFHLDLSVQEQRNMFDLKKELYRLRGLSPTNMQPQLPSPSKSTVYPPHILHDSMRLGFSEGYNSRLNAWFLESELRFVFHDLADPPGGYPNNAAIEFLKLSVRFLKKNSADEISMLFDEFSLVDYTVLNDFSFFKPELSWSIHAGAKRIMDNRIAARQGTFAPQVTYRFGISKILGGRYSLEAHPSLLLYVLLGANVAYSGNFFRNDISPAGEVNAGFKFSVTKNLVLQARYELQQPVNYRYTQGLEAVLRWRLFRDFAIDLQYRRSAGWQQYQAGFMIYF